MESYLRLEPLTLRVNLTKADDESSNNPSIGKVKYTSGEKLSFEPTANNDGDKDSVATAASVATLKAASWEIPAYNEAESWKDQISSILKGYNFGYFRIGLGSSSSSAKDNLMEHIIRVLKHIHKEFEKHPETEFRFEYGFFGVTDVKIIDFATFKSHPISSTDSLHNFVIDATNGVENISHLISEIREKEINTLLPFLCTINVQIIEPNVPYIRKSSIHLGSFGSVYLNELKTFSSLDRSVCSLRNYLLLLQQQQTSINNLEIPLNPLLFLVKDFFGGSAKTICVLDLDENISTREQYSSMLFLDVLKKVKNVAFSQYEDSRFLDLDQLDNLETMMKERDEQIEVLKEAQAAASRSYDRMENEKDRVYRSALKEKADVEYISEGRRVEIVTLKEEIRSKSVDILRLTQTLEDLQLEKKTILARLEKSEESLEASGNEMFQLESKVSSLQESLSQSLKAESQMKDEISDLKKKHLLELERLEDRLRAKEVEVQNILKFTDRNDSALQSLQTSLKDQMSSMTGENVELKKKICELEKSRQVFGLEKSRQVSELDKARPAAKRVGLTKKAKVVMEPVADDEEDYSHVPGEEEAHNDVLEEEGGDDDQDNNNNNDADDDDGEKDDILATPRKMTSQPTKKRGRPKKTESEAGVSNINNKKSQQKPAKTTPTTAAVAAGKEEYVTPKDDNNSSSSSAHASKPRFNKENYLDNNSQSILSSATSSIVAGSSKSNSSILVTPSLVFSNAAKASTMGDLDPDRRRIKLPALKKNAALSRSVLSSSNSQQPPVTTSVAGKSHINKAVFGAIAEGFKISTAKRDTTNE